MTDIVFITDDTVGGVAVHYGTTVNVDSTTANQKIVDGSAVLSTALLPAPPAIDTSVCRPILKTKTVKSISDLSTISSSYTTAIVKDALRGDIFDWSATGIPDGGTVYAGSTGFWHRRNPGNIYHVDWFGADPTEVLDSTAAFQACVNALPLGANDGIISPLLYVNGGRVKLGAGKYKISSTIIAKRGVIFEGTSRESSQIISFTTGSVIQYQDAGRAVPDEICVRDLAIIQSTTVTALSGAAIDVGVGTANPAAVTLNVDNVLIYATYQGVLLSAGICCSVKDSIIASTVSHGVNFASVAGAADLTTSSNLINTYVIGAGGNGYHFTNTDYFTLSGCASDSHVGYGYYFDNCTNGNIHAGTENAASGAAYFKNTRSMSGHIRIVGSASAAHGISLESVNGLKLSGTWSANASQTGYAVHVVTNGGLIELENFAASNIWATNLIDAIDHVKVVRSDLANNFQGGSTSNWAFGKDAGVVISGAQLTVSGIAELTTYRGAFINPAFTFVGAHNIAADIQARIQAGSLTYTILSGVVIENASIGAGNTAARVNGAYIADQSGGTSASTNVALGTATPAVGSWNIYSASTRDSVWFGKQRYLSSIGPIQWFATGTPEAAQTAPIGSYFGRTDGGIGTAFYVKTSGTGNTGWLPVPNTGVGGDLLLGKTITAAGTVGAQTINTPTGSVNFAAGASSLVVTNNLVTANSIITPIVAGNDATLHNVWYVAAAGSFTIFGNAAATAETKVTFTISN